MLSVWLSMLRVHFDSIYNTIHRESFLFINIKIQAGNPA